VEDRYGLRVEVVDATPPNGTPWSASNCCGTAKVDALNQALAGNEAWITGIRREQSPTRATAEPVEWDESRGVWKFNPLVEWTDRDVWGYVNQHDLPYHPLHDRGYESIGCAPCTLPGNGREGRWAGQDKTECGLHV
jgi:phosphoadenosine phosphosulfate reductase